MKKLTLSMALLAYGSVCTVTAQTPERKNVALATKITATWCAPCGSGGWTTAEELLKIPYIKNDFMYLGLFASTNNPTYQNDKFASTDARILAEAFTFSGYPTFHINGANESGDYFVLAQTIRNFAKQTTLVSAASEKAINGNTVTVNTNMKFWGAANGEYYLAAYLVEDGAMNLQNAQGDDPVAHRDVFRATMTPSVWGEKIVSGAITEGQTFSKTFTFNITKSDWVKNNLEVYTVIWKKNGIKFEYVNGSSTGSGTTAITHIAGLNDVMIYPNPTSDYFTVAATLQEASSLDVSITDMLGRIVYNSGGLQASSGTNSFNITTTGLNTGLYNVTIHADKGNVTKPLSIIK